MSIMRTLRGLRDFCRLRSLQTSDASARAQERHRRATLSGITAVSARVVAVGTSIVTVPITLSYLGTERFGIWMAISSVLAIISFADLGIGNGLMNAVADANGRNDIQAMKRAISSGLAILVAIAAVLIGCFGVAYRYVDWARLFNAHSQIARMEAGPALFVFALCFALNIPISLVMRVQMGLQEGFRSYLWQLGGSIAGLVGVLAVVHFRAGLPWLLLALAGSPVAVATINGIVFFFVNRRDLLPTLRFVSLASIRQLGNLGFLFLVLQLVCAVALSSDNFIVARLLSPEAATEYAVPQRMFLVVSSMLAMFLAPLWPAYAEAIGRGDHEWVRSTLFRSLKLALIAAGLALAVLVCGGQQIIHLWVGSRVHAPFVMLLGFAVWTVFEVSGNAIAMFLNGASIVKFQVTITTIFGAVCVAAKIMAARHFGSIAMPWTTAAIYCVCVTAPTLIMLPRLLRGIQSRSPIAVPKSSGTEVMEYA